jgi:hypothetical protein
MIQEGDSSSSISSDAADAELYCTGSSLELVVQYLDLRAVTGLNESLPGAFFRNLSPTYSLQKGQNATFLLTMIHVKQKI